MAASRGASPWTVVAATAAATAAALYLYHRSRHVDGAVATPALAAAAPTPPPVSAAKPPPPASAAKEEPPKDPIQLQHDGIIKDAIEKSRQCKELEDAARAAGRMEEAEKHKDRYERMVKIAADVAAADAKKSAQREQAAVAQAEEAAAAAAKPAKAVLDPAKVAELSRRLEGLVEQLRPTFAGSETRRVLCLELLGTLEESSKLPGKGQRQMARAFVDCDGPEVVYEIESCMKGDWVADAKNGTMRTLSKIIKLEGPIGQAQLTYRGMREKAKTDAAHGNCDHGGGHGNRAA